MEGFEFGGSLGGVARSVVSYVSLNMMRHVLCGLTSTIKLMPIQQKVSINTGCIIWYRIKKKKKKSLLSPLLEMIPLPTLSLSGSN